MESQPDSQGLYYIIPSKLAESGDEKKAILYGLITSLARSEGYAWASNQYMAEKLKVSDRTIQNKLKNLIDDGWVVRAFDNDQTMEGRKLYPQVTVHAMGYTPHETADTPPRKNQHTPPRSQLHHSNISNTSNINLEGGKPPRTPKEEAIEFFTSQEKQQSAINWIIDHGVPESKAKLEVQKFLNYWTELNSTGRKQKWEMEKTFEVKRRFVTWLSRVKEFSTSKQSERTRRIINA